jgi:nicotinate-nucleotide--dimethylbenzimidazole phosphoribosyltransferase
MTRWGSLDAPAPLAGSAPRAGRLQPALRWLAACQGSWPPQPPAAPARVVLPAQGQGSLDSGVARADDLADRGHDLLVVGGTGDPSAGVLVCAALLDLEPVRAVGPTTLDFTRLTVAVRDGLRTRRALRTDPVALLEGVEGSVGELTGLLAQAAARRTPVLLDGSALVAAAALAAGRLAAGAPTWWLATQAPASPAAQAAHRELQLGPLLDLGLDGPEGAEIGLTVLLAALELARA